MLRSLFLLTTSSLVVAACGDDTCGPGSAQGAGLLASSADVVLNYGSLTSGPNNDCPDAAAPAGVTSLTIQGAQVGGPGLLTLCIGRPDLLASGPLQLGTEVRIIDLNGEANSCQYAFESARPVQGTASTSGLCDNGKNSAGYALTVDGALSLKRTCNTAIDTIAVTFDGTVAVEATP